MSPTIPTATKISDLVLSVRPDCDRAVWNEDRFEPFLDLLCGPREYQKEAIRTSLRYALGGEYTDLRALARENWGRNPALEERYGSWSNFERHLQLPDALSATIDLATGAGKSYVMYGIAAILLAEGAVDRVLVLCPSTTIEAGLLVKFRELAGRAELQDAMPDDAKVAAPHIIQATETITPGTICVENREAVYEHVQSSIQDSLGGKELSVAVLNDEAHHVANAPSAKLTKWKEFLLDPAYKFRIVLGFSGTCFVDNEYFSDVIYRYSLRAAIEDNYVKKVKYLSDISRTGEDDEEWQLRVNLHEQRRKDLQPQNIRPLSVVVTARINQAQRVGGELKDFLRERYGLTDEQANERVLVVYSDAPDLARLGGVDDPASSVEWIVSVSMLNEGWDVKRVFQIIPHEERAFNSKLLVSQVLGRGLRIPDQWRGPQAEVTVFNHSAWAGRIKHIVDDVLENEKVVTSRPLDQSDLHFDLHNLTYNVEARSEERPKRGGYDLFSKGYVDIPTQTGTVAVDAEFTSAVGATTSPWRTQVQRKLYTPDEVASQMHGMLTKLDMETAAMEGEGEPTSYATDFPFERLLEIVRRSLKGQEYCTEANKQKLLSALGTARRTSSRVVRYDLTPDQLQAVSTRCRPRENASASQLRRDRIAFVPSGAEQTIEEVQLDFFRDVIEPGGAYRSVPIPNRHDLRSPVNLVFADSDPERKFVLELLKPQNHAHLDSWIKSTPTGFYEIDYAWRKGEHPKRGKFSPDFFLKVKGGELIAVVELKDDGELLSLSPENLKKNQYAVAHFNRLNETLATQGIRAQYVFHFLSPRDYGDFFTTLRAGRIAEFRSQLDVKLSEELQNQGEHA